MVEWQMTLALLRTSTFVIAPSPEESALDGRVEGSPSVVFLPIHAAAHDEVARCQVLARGHEVFTQLRMTVFQAGVLDAANDFKRLWGRSAKPTRLANDGRR